MQQTAYVVEKIWAKVKMAQSRPKSYVDKKRKNLEFLVGDIVFLKVALMKAVMRFGMKEKLSP